MDQFAAAALLLIVVIGGMRLFYGAWPWEARKTWYRTRAAVKYVEALRGENIRNPALRLVLDAVNKSMLGQMRDNVETSSDSFDRSLVYDSSPLEATPPDERPVDQKVVTSLQKLTKRLPIVRRKWLNSSRRKQTLQVAETKLVLTADADRGDQAAG